MYKGAKLPRQVEYLERRVIVSVSSAQLGERLRTAVRAPLIIYEETHPASLVTKTKVSSKKLKVELC